MARNKDLNHIFSTWNKDSANPVLATGPSGAWDSAHVAPGSLIRDTNTFHLLYAGSDGQTWQIGYAKSPDLTTWSKDSENPILSSGPDGAWDETLVHGSSIIKEDDTYHLLYRGQGGARNTDRIGHATSPDLKTWTKNPENPVLDIGRAGAWDDTHVFGPAILRKNETRERHQGGFLGIRSLNIPAYVV